MADSTFEKFTRCAKVCAFFFLGAGSHGLDGEFIYVVDGINVFEKK